MNLKFLLPTLLIFSICKPVVAQNLFKSANELSKDTSGWALVKEWIIAAKNNVKLLPPDNQKAKDALFKTQVTTHSIMGAIIYNTGGILIDHGWIRILASGNTKMERSLPAWNKGKTFKEYGEKPGHLLIGDDAIGGFFAINGGDLGTDIGKVYYWAPETLQWESLDKGYSDFIEFCMNGDLNKFYESFRWIGWEKDVSSLSGDNVYNFYPYLWTTEGKDIYKLTRKVVPIEEQYNFNMDEAQKLKH
jgi:hypothetical protein